MDLIAYYLRIIKYKNERDNDSAAELGILDLSLCHCPAHLQHYGCLAMGTNQASTGEITALLALPPLRREQKRAQQHSEQGTR